MEPEVYDTFMLIIRVFGRAGFVVLIYNLYRLYSIFASPLLKRRNRWFVRGFAGACFISFLLMIAEFFVVSNWLPIITMGFNVITTYILVFYLSRQLTKMENQKSSREYARLVAAMDDYIAQLKHPKQ